MARRRPKARSKGSRRAERNTAPEAPAEEQQAPAKKTAAKKSASS